MENIMHIKSQEYLLQRIKGGSLKGVISVRETWGNIFNISVFIHLKRVHSCFYDKLYMPEGTFYRDLLSTCNYELSCTSPNKRKVAMQMS